MDKTWYWEKGLHDANIISFSEGGLIYDIRDKNPIRNLLKLEIDSTHAIGDTSIKAIKFYNYKIISDIKNPNGLWWKEDYLEEVNNKFVLTIKGHNNDIFKISFEKAEVIR